MSKPPSQIAEFATEAITLAFGWFVCISILTGAYQFGCWVAPHLGWDGNPDSFGLLSSIAIIWLYEHRNIHEKHNRLVELMDGSNSN